MKLITGQTQKEKQYLEYIQKKNHEKYQHIYDDMESKPSDK